jgi:hypothetical protein
MSLADNTADLNRLLGAAAEKIGKVGYCWLLTAAGEGGIRARPMGRLPRDADEEEWTLRFLTDGLSPKVADLPTRPLWRSPGPRALPRASLRFVDAGRPLTMSIFLTGRIDRAPYSSRLTSPA